MDPEIGYNEDGTRYAVIQTRQGPKIVQENQDPEMFAQLDQENLNGALGAAGAGLAGVGAIGMGVDQYNQLAELANKTGVSKGDILKQQGGKMKQSAARMTGEALGAAQHYGGAAGNAMLDAAKGIGSGALGGVQSSGRGLSSILGMILGMGSKGKVKPPAG